MQINFLTVLKLFITIGWWLGMVVYIKTIQLQVVLHIRQILTLDTYPINARIGY